MDAFKTQEAKTTEATTIREALNHPSLPSDQELMRIIDESPFFKNKQKQAEEALAKVDWSKIFGKPDE